MIAYLGQRILSLLFTLFLATIAIFAMMHSVPGGPFSFTQGDMTPAAMHNIMVKYGLADPIWQQYLKWIWQLLHGYLGIPFEEPTMTVNHLIASAWPITLIVGGLTIVVSYTLGLLLGCIAAIKHNTWVDSLITAVVSTIGVALPNYVIGFLLIEVFAIKLGWLPVGGWGSWKDVIMPVVAFSLYPMALMERYTRASTLEVTYADYVRMGRARGPVRAAHPVQVHPAHLADPPDHDHGAVDPEHPYGLDLHRGHLRPARARQLLHHCQPAPGLPLDHGAGTHRRRLVGRLLHPVRHRLRAG